MCLALVERTDFVPEDKPIRAWKVLAPHYQAHLGLMTPLKDARVHADWSEASGELLTTGLAGGKYNAGFHCYLSEEDAEKSYMIWGEQRVFAVELHGKVSYGQGDGGGFGNDPSYIPQIVGQFIRLAPQAQEVV